MNALQNQPDVPAHRVVNRNGLLSGKAAFNPPSAMQTRLECEGILIVDDQIQNFAKHLWNPNLELL